jgi:hypothetical protein
MKKKDTKHKNKFCHRDRVKAIFLTNEEEVIQHWFNNNKKCLINPFTTTLEKWFRQ